MKAILPIAALILIVVAWHLVLALGLVNPVILPGPISVLKSLVSDRVELFGAMMSTFRAVGGGFSLAVGVGLIVAVLLSSSQLLLRAFYPYAVFFQTVPIIAIAPLLVVWFGYGIPSVIASSFIVALFPMIASTLSGMMAADPDLRDLFRLYRAGRLTTMRKLILPSALPYVFSGMRVVAGLSVIGAIVGEFIGGVGLGSVVDIARTQQRLDKVFAAVLLASLLGLALVKAIDLVSWIFLRHWHASSRS